MATRRKDTDVVIIGLGAVGGVAALPLAQAGIDIVALEAGTWLSKRDFALCVMRVSISVSRAVLAPYSRARSIITTNCCPSWSSESTLNL